MVLLSKAAQAVSSWRAGGRAGTWGSLTLRVTDGMNG